MTDNQNPQDQGLNYQPTVPSTGEKGLPIYETPTANTEIQPTPEIQISPEAQKPQPPQPPVQNTTQEDTAQQPAQTANKAPDKNIVDKTTNKEKLHKVGPNADTITSIADKEEEEFIEKVEEHHKH